MKINFKRLDHVQLCVPEGEVENARTFYCEVLGLQEIERPTAYTPSYCDRASYDTITAASRFRD